MLFSLLLTPPSVLPPVTQLTPCYAEHCAEGISWAPFQQSHCYLTNPVPWGLLPVLPGVRLQEGLEFAEVSLGQETNVEINVNVFAEASVSGPNQKR